MEFDSVIDMRAFLAGANVQHIYFAAREAGLRFKSGEFNKAGIIERLSASPSIMRATCSAVLRKQSEDSRRGTGFGYKPEKNPFDDLLDNAPDAPEVQAPIPQTIDASAFGGLAKRVEGLEACTTDQGRSISALIQGAETFNSRLASLEQRKPLVFTIGEKVSSLPVEGQHYLFPIMVQWLMLKRHVFLVGPASSGKTSAAGAFAKMLGLQIYSQPQVVDSFGILGFIGPNGRVSTPFTDAWLNGGVYLIDEMSMNGADALGALNAALAGDPGKRFAPIPGLGYMPAHPDFYCIAGDNSDTGANAKYSARQVLDGATLDRFITIDWPIDPVIEASVAGKHTDWLAAVRAIRAFIEDRDIQHVGATVRALMAGCEALDLAPGLSRKTILETTCRKGLLRDNWDQVLTLAPVRAFLQRGN